MTLCQDDPSANAPWTRTTDLAFSSAAKAGRPIAPIALRRTLKPITPLQNFMANSLVRLSPLWLFVRGGPLGVGPAEYCARRDHIDQSLARAGAEMSGLRRA